MTISTRYVRAALPLLFAIMCSLGGCTGMRFVVDLVPQEDPLTQTVVLEDSGAGWDDDDIALIDVTGIIVDADSPPLIRRENPVSALSEALSRAAEQDDVEAVIIRLNTPGGAVTATDVMYREVQHFRASTGKPVVILMGDLATSGGMYLACAGDHIIAHPTTVTGSIGVIMQFFDLSDGMQRIGIRSNAITSGSNKSMGTPFEPLEPAQRELFQDMVDEFYGRFRDIVITNRPNLSPGELDAVTDGRIVSGARAAEIGLVDETGDLRTAFTRAKTLANVTRARLVKYHRSQEQVGSPYANAPSTGTQVNLLNIDVTGGGQTPAFHYIWDPTVW